MCACANERGGEGKGAKENATLLRVCRLLKAQALMLCPRVSIPHLTYQPCKHFTEVSPQ
jgi:hypothetical protein